MSIIVEPSLAIDWLEISWDELHIKERVGAGSFGTVHRAEWHGSDVAVKVLTIQDFLDDQLKEFLREEGGAPPSKQSWFRNMNLNTAYEKLTSVRPCGPKKRATRGATYDLAKNDQWKEPFENLPEHAFEDVAGWERKLIQDRVRALYGK